MRTSALLLTSVLVINSTGGCGGANAQARQAPGSLLQLRQEGVIGVADGPPEYAFGDVRHMVVRAGGAFFLFDEADTQIRRYDPLGRFVGPVGRGGGGPGEYRRVSGMAMSGDTLLLVLDPANGRISLFDTLGTFRNSLSFQRGEFFGEKAIATDDSGMIYVRAAVRGGSAGGEPLGSQYLLIRMDGVVEDSIALPSLHEDKTAFVLITPDGPRWSFPARFVYAVLREGGLATARADQYRVEIAGKGLPVRYLQREYSPIQLGVEERREWLAWASYLSRERSTPSVSIPRTKPTVRDILVDAHRRIWVSLYTRGTKRQVEARTLGDRRPLLTIREANVFDIFGAQGTYLGRVQLPQNSVLFGITRHAIWVRTEADDGQVSLVRYRIEGLRAE